MQGSIPWRPTETCFTIALVMELRTLVLSPWMQSHGIVGWQAAIVLVVDGKVDVLENYEATVASAGNRYEGRSPIVLEVPAVVRLRKAIRMHKDGVKFSRANVLTRDGCRCCYCGARKHPKELNYDHVVPRIQGGKTVWENIVTSCYPCNGKKGARTPKQAGLTMHFQPHRPKVLSNTRPMLLDSAKVPELWKPYLGELAETA
jgi:5-methylcytosine-specific restriction endonuclease McrA